jgi:hypothetical protein
MAIDSPQWKLPSELIALSQEHRWPQVLSEWKLDCIEYLKDNEPAQTCLCHHHPIRELCYISNIVNQHQAVVGNCCIARFDNGQSSFTGINKIFTSFKRIKEDISASANKPLIEYAFKRGAITAKDKTFYLNILHKRKLTERQWHYKQDLNDRIIRNLSRTTTAPTNTQIPFPVVTAANTHSIALQTIQSALYILQANPSMLAAKSLIKDSFQHHFISARDYSFYISLFEHHVRHFSTKQRSWMGDINRKILNSYSQQSH